MLARKYNEGNNAINLRFGTFDYLKDHFANEDGQLSPLGRLGCGLGAGVAEATLVVTWVETLKVRLISDQKKKNPQFRGLAHAASTILRTEVGLRMLYNAKSLHLTPLHL